MADEAIRPDTYFNLPTFKEKEVTVETLTDDEKSLISLSNHSGWTVMKRYIEQVERDLDNVNYIAIANGAGFEEIGRNTVVINLTKGIIDKIKNRVQDIKDQADGSGK